MNDLKFLMIRPPQRTLAVAESLTSGRVQARIGMVSGASGFFLGGITAYSLEQKVRHLGVNRAQAEAVNSVSAEVAEQMARGVCTLFGSDIGVSTTGYAEPSADWNVAEPYAWWALAHNLGAGKFVLRHGRVDCSGESRTAVQEDVADAVIGGLIAYLREIRA
jgi:nicotinamide-nucleotide amidase